MKKTLLAVALMLAATPAWAQVRVVAAENFYGDLVQQLGGTHVAVTSILSNPNDDPHLFEASAKTARALAEARIVIANGVDYDPWMEKLTAATARPISRAGPRARNPSSRPFTRPPGQTAGGFGRWWRVPMALAWVILEPRRFCRRREGAARDLRKRKPPGRSCRPGGARGYFTMAFTALIGTES
jgi:hypothetical protein